MELVDSVDDLRSLSSNSWYLMPNFEVLNANIASALNKIMHNSQSRITLTCSLLFRNDDIQEFDSSGTEYFCL